jgi:4-aminobutyrate aminotransferase-like enzyme
MHTRTSRVEKMCRGVLRHVQSHLNDALSVRIVTTVISTMRKEGMAEGVVEKGDYFLRALRDVYKGNPLIADVRGRDLMLGVELSLDSAHRGEAIQWELIERGT